MIIVTIKTTVLRVNEVFQQTLRAFMEIFGVNASLFWFLLGVFFLVLEAMTPGFFLLFFGLGAWVTSALAFLPFLGVNIQWAIFIAVSVVALAVFRNKLKAFFQGRGTKGSSLDDPVFSSQYIGREVTILRAVNSQEPGLAELNGTDWQAKTEGGPLVAGDHAWVIGLDGLTLVVSKEKPQF